MTYELGVTIEMRYLTHLPMNSVEQNVALITYLIVSFKLLGI